jgi:hypothetical protein
VAFVLRSAAPCDRELHAVDGTTFYALNARRNMAQISNEENAKERNENLMR